MFKTLVLAVCGLMSAVSAVNIEHSKEQWLAAVPKSGFLKLHDSLDGSLGSTASKVSWSECDSQHLYDVATGTASPNPPIVGNFVGLNLDVIFNSDVNVVANYVYVQFTAAGGTDPIALFAQDYPATTPGDYGAGDEFTDSISWLVPSFAPLGHYHVSITVHGANKDKDKWACLVADFDIHG